VLLLIGTSVLIFGAPMRRFVTRVLVTVALGYTGMAWASDYLLADEPYAEPYSVAAIMSIEHSGISVGGFRLDLECTGSLLCLLVALSISLHALAQPCFRRAYALRVGPC